MAFNSTYNTQDEFIDAFIENNQNVFAAGDLGISGVDSVPEWERLSKYYETLTDAQKAEYPREDQNLLGAVFTGSAYVKLSAEAKRLVLRPIFTKALLTANAAIDAHKFIADKKTTSQQNEFPRQGQAEVPFEIKRAEFIEASARFISDFAGAPSREYIQLKEIGIDTFGDYSSASKSRSFNIARSDSRSPDQISSSDSQGLSDSISIGGGQNQSRNRISRPQTAEADFNASPMYSITAYNIISQYFATKRNNIRKVGLATARGRIATSSATGGGTPIVITDRDASVKTEQLTFYHDPNQINKNASLPMYRIIQILQAGGTPANLYTQRQTGSFVSAANFRPLTIEGLAVDDETHTAIVATVPGNFNDYTYLSVDYNDNNQELAKQVDIPIATIANGFDWVIPDARAATSPTKRELRIRVRYNTDSNTTSILFHQEAVPSAQDTSTEIYLFSAFFIRETAIATGSGTTTTPPDLSAYSTTAEVDAKDAVVLASARAYTDANSGSGGGTVDLTNYYTKAQSDTNDATTLQSAENFTYPKASIDNKDAITLSSARTDATTKANKALADAKAADIALPTIAEPGQQILLKAKNVSGNTLMLGATPNDMTAELNSIDDAASQSIKLDAKVIKDGTVDEDHLTTAVKTKLNATGGGLDDDDFNEFLSTAKLNLGPPVKSHNTEFDNETIYPFAQGIIGTFSLNVTQGGDGQRFRIFVNGWQKVHADGQFLGKTWAVVGDKDNAMAFTVKSYRRSLVVGTVTGHEYQIESELPWPNTYFNEGTVLNLYEKFETEQSVDLTNYYNKSEVDGKDATTLTDAKAYTDQQIVDASSGEVNLDAYITRADANDNDAAVLQQAKDYTFSQAQITAKDAAVLRDAKADATTKDADILELAKAYTDANAGSGGGITTIPNGSITTAKLADDAVTGTKIANNAVGTNHLVSKAVGLTELSDNVVTVLNSFETKANVASGLQAVKDASRFLLASWRGDDGDPFTANGGSLPVAYKVAGATYDATNDWVDIGTGTQGIGWENNEIDFDRFEMIARFQVGQGWNEMFYWGVRDEFALNTNGTFGWTHSTTNSGFAILITPNSSGRIRLMAFNRELTTNTIVAEEATSDFTTNKTHEIRISVVNGEIKVKDNETGTLQATFKIPSTLPANALGAVGGRFGMVHDGDPNDRNVKLQDMYVKQPDINTFDDTLTLPVPVGIADGSITAAKLGTNAVIAPKIATGAVTAAKVGNNAITTTKVANGAITEAKLSAAVQQKITSSATGPEFIQTRNTSDSQLLASNTALQTVSFDFVNYDYIKLHCGAGECFWVKISDINTVTDTSQITNQWLAVNYLDSGHIVQYTSTLYVAKVSANNIVWRVNSLGFVEYPYFGHTIGRGFTATLVF